MRQCFILFVILLIGTCAFAETENVINVSKNCQFGLTQPEGGDFAAFVFCDDALGTQIGIVYTVPSGGPVEVGTDWSIYNRFWQEGPWMKNVKQIAWSKSGQYLYVVTSEIYSEEALFEIDIPQRKAVKLLDAKETKDYIKIDMLINGVLFVNGREFTMKQ